MKEIPLTQGFVALVDDSDFDRVSAHKWCVSKTPRNFYAKRAFPKGDGTQGWIRLHQFLMPGVKEIDHRDGNGLNNCRDNLRPCNRRQNQQAHKRKRADVTSKYRGVSWHPKVKKWQASLSVNGKTVYLGIFTREEDAARAYDAAVIKRDPQFFSLNFSENPNELCPT